MKHQNLYIGIAIAILLLGLWWWWRKPKAAPETPHAVDFGPDTPMQPRRPTLIVPRFRQATPEYVS